MSESEKPKPIGPPSESSAKPTQADPLAAGTASGLLVEPGEIPVGSRPLSPPGPPGPPPAPPAPPARPPQGPAPDVAAQPPPQAPPGVAANGAAAPPSRPPAGPPSAPPASASSGVAASAGNKPQGPPVGAVNGSAQTPPQQPPVPPPSPAAAPQSAPPTVPQSNGMSAAAQPPAAGEPAGVVEPTRPAPSASEEPARAPAPAAAALTGSDPELEIPAELVERIREVVAERCRIEGLISAVERERADVKEDIYLKVRSDYEAQLQAVLHAYEPLKVDAQKELVRLREKEADLEVSLAKVEDELSELRFRCRVGEFAEDELARAEKSRLTDVAKCETRLERLRATFSLADSLLGDDARLPAPTPSVASAAAQWPAQAPVAQERVAQERAPEAPQAVVSEPDPYNQHEALADVSDSAPSPTTLPPTEPRVQAPPAGPVAVPATPQAASAPGVGVPGVAVDPYLVLLTPEGEERYPIGESGISLGRSKTNHIVLAEPGVSRRHAIVGWQDGEVVIEDQSSGGGVVLNGQFVERAVLRPGDIIQVVSFQLKYVAG